jgi:hypothetical protein
MTAKGAMPDGIVPFFIFACILKDKKSITNMGTLILQGKYD